MITQEQIVQQINNLSTCNNLANLDFAQKEVFKQIERAATIDHVTKSSLKNLLNSKTSQVEMNFYRNLKSRLDSFVSQTQSRINYISLCDWLTLNRIESEVKGTGSSLSWIEKELFGVSFASARNLLSEILKQRANLISLIDKKKSEFEDEDRKSKERLTAIALLEKKRREEERKRREEEERRRRLAEQQRQAMLQRMGQLRGNNPP